MAKHRLPSYFISHGGGPWPWMKPQLKGAYDELEASLQAVPRQLGQTPKAALVISGHWEEPEFTVMAAPRPPMVYDYADFPAHTYEITYPAPGSPALADQVQTLIKAAGMPARLDLQRGFDHGTFVPLFAIYPEAQVPVLQLSLKSSYDPAEHLALGRALAPLRDEGVLIIGSGLSYHNVRAFGPSGRAASKDFDHWLQSAVVDSSPAERSRHLLDWASAPAARMAHPREDHLLPLMVAVGAAESESAQCVYHEADFFGNLTVSSFMFGEGRVPS
ncbi:class III extradiol ring-cleavage dioxygenase [Aquabacterium sp.]|uniref:DODA-type extradiol aromatic ring-opening family dioxygenase n=1 Tax=Aquabacterium sp. TaxID=1872578 RepID=UPI00248785C9|nr:class III extradiol ring-cleavage dioxygenase [Aquabacterium sp.]MDI1258856.1 class III extradiol ring-cleavage dioxygenase [Aquabacterium sp.]